MAGAEKQELYYFMIATWFERDFYEELQGINPRPKEPHLCLSSNLKRSSCHKVRHVRPPHSFPFGLDKQSPRPAWLSKTQQEKQSKPCPLRTWGLSGSSANHSGRQLCSLFMQRMSTLMVLTEGARMHRKSNTPALLSQPSPQRQANNTRHISALVNFILAAHWTVIKLPARIKGRTYTKWLWTHLALTVWPPVNKGTQRRAPPTNLKPQQTTLLGLWDACNLFTHRKHLSSNFKNDL